MALSTRLRTISLSKVALPWSCRWITRQRRTRSRPLPTPAASPSRNDFHGDLRPASQGAQSNAGAGGASKGAGSRCSAHRGPTCRSERLSSGGRRPVQVRPACAGLARAGAGALHARKRFCVATDSVSCASRSLTDIKRRATSNGTYSLALGRRACGRDVLELAQADAACTSASHNSVPGWGG